MRARSALPLALVLAFPAALAAAPGPAATCVGEEGAVVVQACEDATAGRFSLAICSPTVEAGARYAFPCLKYAIDPCPATAEASEAGTCSVRPPAGLGLADPWIDSNGDKIWGPLRLADALVFEAGGSETRVVFDGVDVRIDGSRVCTEDGACVAAPTPIDCGAGGHLQALGGAAGAGLCSVAVADGAVSSASIADGGISADDLADGSVTSGKLAPDAVTEEKLAPGSVGSVAIQDASIAREHLAASSVDGAAILDGAVASDDLAGSSVLASHLGEPCAPGEVLARGATGWECANVRAPRAVVATFAGSAPIPATCTNLGSVQVEIDAPSDGTILVRGLVVLTIQHSSGVADEARFLAARGGTPECSASSGDQGPSEHRIPSGLPTDSGYKTTLPVSASIPVGGATRVTILLNGQMTSGASPLDRLLAASLEAVFVPSG